MSDEFETTARPNFAFPKLTAEARALCAGDASRPELTTPQCLIDHTPATTPAAKWVEMVSRGHELYRTPGSAQKGEATLKLMDNFGAVDNTQLRSR